MLRLSMRSRGAVLGLVSWLGYVSMFGALILIFAEPIMRLFTRDEAVIAAGTNGLRVVALSQPFWAIQLVLSGALRGTGDTRFPLVVGSIGMWVGVGLAALLVTLFQGGLAFVGIRMRLFSIDVRWYHSTSTIITSLGPVHQRPVQATT